jgi:hypothetical protein
MAPMRVLVLLVTLGAIAAAHAQPAFRGASSGSAGPQYVGAGTASAAGNACGTSLAPSTPAGAVGDLLVALATAADASTLTPSAGWSTLLSVSPAVDHQARIYWRFANGSASDTLTIGRAGVCNVAIAQIARFSGVDPTTPFDTGIPIPAANCTAGGARVKCSYQNAASVTSGTETTTSASTLLLLAIFIRDNNTTNASGSGFTQAFDSGTATGNNAEIALNYRPETTAGAKGPFTLAKVGGSDPNTGVLFALRAAADPLTIITNAATQVGDLLVASVAVQPSGVAITPPAGWTAQAATVQGSANSSRQQIFYRFASTGGAVAYTWTFSSGHAGAVGGIATYGGVDTSTPIDAFGGNVTASGTNHTATAITTTVANTRVVSAHSYTSSQTWTPAAGMTERLDVATLPTGQADGISLEMADVSQPAAGTTGNKIATAAGSADAGVAHLIALRAAFSFDVLSGDYTVRCAGTPMEVTIIVRDPAGNVQTGYTGSIVVSTSTSNGAWAISSGNGTLNSLGAGAASYQFVSADLGMVRLNLANTVATTLTVTVVDSATGIAATGATSINFITEGYSIVLDPVQVAGRPQNIVVTHLVAPACTPSTTNGHGANNAIRAWLTLDPAHPAGATLPGATGVNTVNPLPTAQPGVNNLTLDFSGPGALTAGQAPLTLSTSDVGKYILSLRDTATAIRGTSQPITTRPFGLAFRGANAATAIAHGSTAASGLLAAAGDPFTMTLAAYIWAAGEDSVTAGVPNSNANITNNGLTPRFAAAVDVAPTTNLPGVSLGAVARGASCANPASAAAASFSGGSATLADWCYTEAGNVFLSATAINYLDTPGVNVTGNSGLDGTGAAAGYVGRFRPKQFAVSAPTLASRADISPACSPASVFTYMSERLDLGFTLTAQNTQGGTTQNYDGAYAKLAVGTVGSFGLGARSGTTDLSTRIDTSLGAAGSWAAGAAVLAARTAIMRLAVPDGPYGAVGFGIAPSDSDGVQMNTLDLDVDNNAANDHKSLGVSTDVRFGRLRLTNAYGSGTIDLPVDLRAEYYNGSAFTTNVDDDCTALVPGNFLLTYVGGSSITSVNLPAGNISVSGTLAAGLANLRLIKPTGALANPGGVTLCLDLDAGAGGDATCVAASPAAKAYLQGPWGAATYDKDPRASLGFGLFGSQPRNFIFFRENY